MARRYGDPVRVTLAQAGQVGQATQAGDGLGERRPTSFTWRGRRYWVSVLGTWRLRTQWWREQPADRTYYRVVTADHQVFELYHDAASSVWVLDVCQD